jgi:hypothetical protein
MALGLGNFLTTMMNTAAQQNPLMRVLQAVGTQVPQQAAAQPQTPQIAYSDPMISNQTTGANRPRQAKTSAGESYAYNYYLKKGLNPAAAAGIVGNLAQESAFRDDVLTGKRMGDNGASGFAAQWQGSRLTNLKAYAAARGEDTPSLNTQLDFVLEEGNSQSPYKDDGAVKAMQLLSTVGDVGQASDIFRTHFERPSAPDSARRRAHAMRIAGVTADPNFTPTATASAKPNALGRVLSAVTGQQTLTAGEETKQPQSPWDRVMASVTQVRPQAPQQAAPDMPQAEPAVDTGAEEIAGLQEQLAQRIVSPRQSAAQRRQELTAKTRYKV